MSDKPRKETIPEEDQYIRGEERGSRESKNGRGEDLKGGRGHVKDSPGNGGESRQELPVKKSTSHEKDSDISRSFNGKDDESLEHHQQQQKKEDGQKSNSNVEEDSAVQSDPRVQSFLQQQPHKQVKGSLSPLGHQAQRFPQQQQRKQDIRVQKVSTAPPVQHMPDSRQQPRNKQDISAQKGVTAPPNRSAQSMPQQPRMKQEASAQKGAVVPPSRSAQGTPQQTRKKEETSAQKGTTEPPNRPAQDMPQQPRKKQDADAQKNAPAPSNGQAQDMSQQARQKQDLNAQKGTPVAAPDQHAQGKPSTPSTKPEPAKEEKVELGSGLPALPPKPAEPQRKLNNNNVPEGNQDVKPQLNLPPGSDLGVVGKIGAYQMSQTQPTSSATDIHANVYFWVYALTLFVTLFIMKKQK